MDADPEKMNCLEFQAQLSEMMSRGEDVYSHPHVQACERCRALLVDLEIIAEKARGLYPGEGPFIH